MVWRQAGDPGGVGEADRLAEMVVDPVQRPPHIGAAVVDDLRRAGRCARRGPGDVGDDPGQRSPQRHRGKRVRPPAVGHHPGEVAGQFGQAERRRAGQCGSKLGRENVIGVDDVDDGEHLSRQRPHLVEVGRGQRQNVAGAQGAPDSVDHVLAGAGGHIGQFEELVPVQGHLLVQGVFQHGEAGVWPKPAVGGEAVRVGGGFTH